jgi:hypothetical protein
MWMEEQPSERVNRLRMQDAVASGADMVVTACPFCLQMFEDAARELESETEKRLEVLDLVELLERAVAEPAIPVDTAPALEVGAASGDGRAARQEALAAER